MPVPRADGLEFALGWTGLAVLISPPTGYSFVSPKGTKAWNPPPLIEVNSPSGGSRASESKELPQQLMEPSGRSPQANIAADATGVKLGWLEAPEVVPVSPASAGPVLPGDSPLGAGSVLPANSASSAESPPQAASANTEIKTKRTVILRAIPCPNTNPVRCGSCVNVSDTLSSAGILWRLRLDEL